MESKESNVCSLFCAVSRFDIMKIKFKTVMVYSVDVSVKQ